jgi:hypothetical protein
MWYMQFKAFWEQGKHCLLHCRDVLLEVLVGDVLLVIAVRFSTALCTWYSERDQFQRICFVKNDHSIMQAAQDTLHCQWHKLLSMLR